MKRLLGAACGLAGLSALEAHESWAPHTHLLEQRHSDLFILLVSGLVVLAAGVAWARRVRQVERRRRASLSEVSRRAAASGRGGHTN